MRNRIKGVSIKVHPLFFDKVFEQNRRALERKFNKPLTQVEFTGILANNGVKFELKKISNKFVPKQFKKKRFYLI